MSGGFVYFIRRITGEGPIKIGFSQTPVKRLDALMVWSPYPLEIVATFPGSLDTEARFHARHKDSRSHKEWFHESEPLLADIHAICAETFDVDCLPDRYGRPVPPPYSDPLAGREMCDWIQAECERPGFRVPLPAHIFDHVDAYEMMSRDERRGFHMDVVRFMEKIETKAQARAYKASLRREPK